MLKLMSCKKTDNFSWNKELLTEGMISDFCSINEKLVDKHAHHHPWIFTIFLFNHMLNLEYIHLFPITPFQIYFCFLHFLYYLYDRCIEEVCIIFLIHPPVHCDVTKYSFTILGCIHLACPNQFIIFHMTYMLFIYACQSLFIEW